MTISRDYDCNRCDNKRCKGDIIRLKNGKTRPTVMFTTGRCPSYIPVRGTFELRELLLFHPESFMTLHNAGFRVHI